MAKTTLFRFNYLFTESEVPTKFLLSFLFGWTVPFSEGDDKKERGREINAERYFFLVRKYFVSVFYFWALRD